MEPLQNRTIDSLIPVFACLILLNHTKGLKMFEVNYPDIFKNGFSRDLFCSLPFFWTRRAAAGIGNKGAAAGSGVKTGSENCIMQKRSKEARTTNLNPEGFRGCCWV